MLMQKLFEQTGAGPRLVTDTHLAALAIQLDATLATNDTDFGRYPGLRTVNPLG
jgi:predicted nucleic acid-binding protein